MKNFTRIFLFATTIFVMPGMQKLIAQPANDQCSGAIAVGSLPWTSSAINVTNATTTGDPAAPSCQTSVARSIWFTFVPSSTASYYISTCQSDASGSTLPDIVLGIYTSSSGCGGTYTQVACDDDGCSTLSLQSVITSVSLSAGTTYYIVAWQYCSSCSSPSSGANSIQLYVTGPPANNECSNAVQFTSGSLSLSGNTNSATQSATGCVGTANDDVWYKFTSGTAPASSTLTATPSGTDPINDIVMQLYTGSCASLTSVVCRDLTGTSSSETYTFSPTASTDYFVRVYSYFSTPSDDGQFTISLSAAALPLELSSFSGSLTASSNNLLWETLSEKNVQWHIVERSIDGSQWNEIGRKAGQTDSHTSLKYELEDRTPPAKAYYRLRSVDFDGQENLSNTIVLTRKGDHFAITAAFPSPANDQVTLQFASLTEENVRIAVMDLHGRLVLEQRFDAQNGINEVPVQIGNLQAGVYFVSISNATTEAAPVRIVKK